MPRPALTYSIGRTLNAQRWHPRPLTTISRITTKCIHIPTRPAERFSRRVLQFEHLGARFCCLPTCHTRFCASPPSACFVATTRLRTSGGASSLTFTKGLSPTPLPTIMT
ncbi:hypothetical protein HBI56_117400 [Parastagonospora nodorum]|uniref:Uncharacterized protein n=1 Tax=Phaeosphaeria nodorum (strain SN15 / ATCC MYA-4574 / FGSC 10173) TaxID=321614 RepID=A0A7U2F8M1_PHANO|nr:hypothetical protein HBH56_200320 [Parastagonospora nodorum]QRD00773.1 hypothetical protein JI435_415770 [Parastagonospora nodorum SN15]KAH3925734.1 hypothetical protein HBH54_175980 [Parastagonospora nodorum]KAH3953305.1 hypothetical protein HBH53_037360 [Parastagonospora nodorum]KAH3976370.1 hypothetical protein HBH52_121290 [Parastagonospora nodorum]